MSLQIIYDQQGKELFVVVPVDEYKALQQYKAIATLDDNEDNWEEVYVQPSDNDNETIPHQVIDIMLEQDISLLASWRIYRGLSQYDVAKKTGLTQSSISQAEKKGSTPQLKTCKRLAVIYQCDPKQLVL
ncbi:helix-turn-helix domain-containing protein [Phocoenobacter skyensis]|uniref:Helix-turn-helix n=1 Tax=Phocoenobacter skyensis TaxID=97481 RepID=A0A1H7U2X9_9PAST|nr:helix-turn-helix transcriptional regulator [Pasteurella skyensis]MDP8078722.1 helix-turn-helix transcriptional regulator [Pasteurella skyensis]MDP8084716.1 helix-turn-helix transcriptional regulator [Pasteurella skyensis]MDP8184138.1 helix-turn-helix transcriptional regulator [Pasteurella skyensis]QLB22798.1 transcriptional regulator [Pasteurella skyensis]SEL91135.1 Helix-turn-helix [Pasteurella skyensis]